MTNLDGELFRISIPDAELDLLRRKLELTRFPDELRDAAWDLGSPLAPIQRLVGRWKNGFDWREWEAKFNLLPQFTKDIEVDGFGTLNIHYVHQRSDVSGAIPLLFVHGWPGHFLEVAKILPLLASASQEHPQFHVVALSLPGFGFSSAPSQKGFRIAQYAEVGHKLMLSLEYNEYVTQAGDWGQAITRIMAFKYGETHLKAWHTNYPNASPPELRKNPLVYLSHLVTPYTEAERKGLERTKEFVGQGIGYYQLQGTKPQTLSYSLADSPAGLLGWIYEKLVAWSDDYPWEDDEVLAWVSIYWFSRAGPAASLRIYYEVYQAFQTGAEGRPTGLYSVPMGASYFPREISRPPSSCLHSVGRVVFESVHEKGGHFAAHEQPEALVGDLRKMFAKGGPAFGVVKGSSGYAE